MNKLRVFMDKLMPTEVWYISIFFILQLFIGGNSIYFLILFLLFVVVLFRTRNILETLWLVFLASLPFSRGKYFEFLVLPSEYWGGPFDLNLNAAVLFSDFLLLGIIYLVISRYKEFKETLLKKNYAAIYLSLLIFIVVSFISSYKSIYSWTSFYYFIQLSKLVVIFYIGQAIFSKEQVGKKSFLVLVSFLLLNSLLVVAQYLKGGQIGLGIEGQSVGYGAYGLFATENPTLFRAGGFSPDPNLTATLIGITLPIIFLSFFIKKYSKGLIGSIVFFLFIFSLILTASRSMWIIVAVVLAIEYLYLKNKKKMKLNLINKKGVLITSLVIVVLLFPIISKRLSTLTDIFAQKGGATYRIEHLLIAKSFVERYPVGVGVGTFRYSMAHIFPPSQTGIIPSDAHNIFAKVSGETGIVGLAFFAIFLTLIMKKKYLDSIDKPLKFSILLSTTTFLLSSLFFPWFLHPLMSVVFWILISFPLDKKLVE